MNTVYILGAGFSMPFFPDQGHLLTDLFNFRVVSMHNTPDMEFVAAQATLREWFEEQFGQQYSAVWLEDIFTWLDHVAGTSTPTDDVRAIQALKRRLNFTLAYYFIRAPQRASTIMRRRIKAMQQRSALMGIISLDWDVLLERTGRRFDYGLAVHDRTGNRINEQRINLLKLHGSAHWWSCSKCCSVVCDETLQMFFEVRCPVCGKDNTRFDPILMTPTLIKEPGQGVLAEVWRLAFVLLARADEIVFMGYSLPQADHAVFHLVTQAKRANAVVRAVLLERDRHSLADQRFQTLIPQVQQDFTGIDNFLEVG